MAWFRLGLWCGFSIRPLGFNHAVGVERQAATPIADMPRFTGWRSCVALKVCAETGRAKKPNSDNERAITKCRNVRFANRQAIKQTGTSCRFQYKLPFHCRMPERRKPRENATRTIDSSFWGTYRVSPVRRMASVRLLYLPVIAFQRTIASSLSICKPSRK